MKLLPFITLMSFLMNAIVSTNSLYAKEFKSGQNKSLITTDVNTHNNKNFDLDPNILTQIREEQGLSDLDEDNATDTAANSLQEAQVKSSTSAKTPQLRPKLATADLDDKIEAQFDNADLVNVLDWVAQTFQVIFISGDILNPKLASKVSDSKITFRTNEPLTKQSMWDLFLSFLDLANRTLVPQSYTDGYPSAFKVVDASAASEKSAPFPVFIGTDWQELPDDDTKIRYIYFIENSTVAALGTIAEQLKSKNATVVQYATPQALIISDKAANVRSLMQVIKELDSVSLPEMMQVIKLKHANAEEIIKLWDSIMSSEKAVGGVEARLFPAKKTPTAIYFGENTRIIAEPNSNSLIIFGTKSGIQKVEDFIAKYIDTSIRLPYSPLYIYELQYANATDVATILNAVVKFDETSEAAKHGGVRDGDKYFKPGIAIIAEASGNRLLIKAEKDDYIKIEQIIKTLDIKQPQVAIEVLIVEVVDEDRKELGAQLRNPRYNTLENNIDFQTSGLAGAGRGVVIDPAATANRPIGNLLGNLVTLAAGQGLGSTLVSIGNNVGGVWALLKVLQTRVRVNVVSHPFLITTNNFKAYVTIGQTRRVATGTVTGAAGTQQSEGDIKAALLVEVTPQINSNGIITMAITITINSFIATDDFTSANIDEKKIVTTANVANKEILALGGLVKTNIIDQVSKVPILGDVPLFGWFFKNKTKIESKNNLLVFISPQIIEPRLQGGLSSYACKKTKFAKRIMGDMHEPVERRDPIHRWFFADAVEEQTHYVDDFVTKKYHGEHRDVKKSKFYNPAPSACGIGPDGNPLVCSTDTKSAAPQRRRRSITEHLPSAQETHA